MSSSYFCCGTLQFPQCGLINIYFILFYSIHGANLFVGDWRLFLIGQLDARAEVCSEVGLAADQQDPRAGAEVLDLCFPLPQTG